MGSKGSVMMNYMTDALILAARLLLATLFLIFAYTRWETGGLVF
jgi:hypothetical protein